MGDMPTPDLSGYDPNASASPTGITVLHQPDAQAPAVPGVDPKEAARKAQQQALNPLQTDPEEVADWWARIDKSQKRNKDHEDEWDTLMKEYLPMVSASGKSEDIKVNAHFRNVHTKIGQLFVRSPEIRLTPEGPATDMLVQMNPQTGMPVQLTSDRAIFVKQAVINKYMSADYIDGVRLMDESLFDIQAWAGLAWVKVGYRATSKPVQKPVMQPDPTYVPPAPASGILGLGPQQPPPQVPVMGPDGVTPQMQTIQVPIHKEWYANRFSPKKGLLDELLNSSRHAKLSRWIGMEFFIPKRQAMRDLALTEDDIKACAEDDRIFKDTRHSTEASGDLVHGFEIWYLAYHFRDDQIHPLAVNQLILIDGLKDRTVVHRPSPDQTFDATGALSQDSLIGFPIKVGCLRDVADSPYPAADSAFTNSQVKQLNTSRRQSVKLRDAAIGKYFYDTAAIDDDDLELIKNGEVGEFIGVKEGLLAQGADKIFWTTAQVKSTTDDMRVAATIKSDMNETLGITETSAGAMTDTVRSATEIQDAQAASAGRQEKEQARAIGFYLEIVRAVDTLLVRYMSGQDYVSVAGEDGTKQLMMWSKKIVDIRCSYSIKPDSQLKIDTARDRQQKISAYTTLAPDPLVNRAPMIRDIARDFGWDPSTIILSPEQQAAAQIGAPGAQPQHPGGNKHATENSGQRPNAPGSRGDTRNERNPGTPAAVQAAGGATPHPPARP